MEKANSRYLVIGLIVTMIVAVIGVTYAFWRGLIQGEGAGMSVTLDKVYIQFIDNTEIAETNVVPGWSTSKTFTVENQGNSTFIYDIFIENLINTLVTDGYFQYKITSDNNGYNIDEFMPIAKANEAIDFDLGTSISIEPGVIQTYTIEFRYVNDPDVDQSEDIGKKFSGELMIRESTSSTLYSILSNGIKYTVSERNTAATSPIEGTTIAQGYNSTEKIYLAEDNYYFAGNPSDNWVKFANKWWRIIRSNSSEGTRLLYAGTSHDGQDGYINDTKYVWSSSYNDPKYVEWSYASSTIGEALTTWYNANITGTNANMVNTSVAYCNDTSVASTSGGIQYFGAYDRLNTNKAPSHSCGTNSNSTHRSIGLMTADEVAFAGGVYGNNAPNTYYYRNSKTSGCTGSSGDTCSVTGNNYWWTMSPSDAPAADVFLVHGAGSGPGHLSGTGVTTSRAVRPVITLKPSVTVSGTGTTDDPYVVVSDGSSSKLEVKVTSNDDNMGTVDPVSQKVAFGSDVRVTLNPKSGYVYSSNDCGGIVEDNVMTIKNITDNKECKVTFVAANNLYAILSNGSKYTVGERGTFDRPWGASSANSHATISQVYNQTGTIYLAEDNYYFAGNPSDNWVKFAGFWWRIIRSNSTEGTRLLYAGTSHDGQDGYINNTTYQWYSSDNNASYVQWSYASSTIGNALTTWYNSNITGTNANMVNTSVAYCNDTSVASTSGSTQYFGAYGRLSTNKAPSHSCGTNSNSTHRSVGLMTADEVAFAGGELGYNSPNTYYYRNSKPSGCTGSSGDPCSVTKDNYWWTMSPYLYPGARVFIVGGAGVPGYLSSTYVNYSNAVRPVVTLKSSVLVSGSGTTSDPYVPSL